MDLQAQQHLGPVSPHSAAGSVYSACGALQSSPLLVYLVYHYVYHHSLVFSLHKMHCVNIRLLLRLHEEAVPMPV